MIAAGKHIDDLGEDLSWRDLLVIVSHSHPRTSAVHRALNPDESEWQLSEQLLAVIADDIAWLRWAQTKDAGKASNPPPNRIPRPGVTADETSKPTRVGDPMTADEFDRRYAEKSGLAA